MSDNVSCSSHCSLYDGPINVALEEQEQFSIDTDVLSVSSVSFTDSHNQNDVEESDSPAYNDSDDMENDPDYELSYSELIYDPDDVEVTSKPSRSSEEAVGSSDKNNNSIINQTKEWVENSVSSEKCKNKINSNPKLWKKK